MDTKYILQTPSLVDALKLAKEDIAYGRVIIQQEGETIEDLLYRVTNL